LGKRLIIITVIIFGICISIPGKAAFAESIETVTSEGETASSGLYLDVHDLAEYRAERGLKNLEPHSIVLTNIGLKAYDEKREKEAIAFFKKAKELSPDLPTPYLYLAKANFSLSLKGFHVAWGYLLDAWRAFWNNFWWSFQVAGVLFISLFLALYASIIVVLIVLVSSKFRLYIHDIIEDRRKILLLLPSIILVFFGPIFGLIGFMMPFWTYLKRREKATVYFIAMISAVIILMLPLLSSFLGASQDKVLRSIVKINEGTHTGETPEAVIDGRGYEAIFTYALDFKRRGYRDKVNFIEAIRMYESLLNQRDDAKVHNNLANCYVGLGNYDKALGHYNKALQLTKMASTYYNLSQIYREVFNFSDAKKYYQDAIKIDPRKVAFYNSVKGMSINRFVMDEPLSNKELWSLAFKWHPYYKSSMFLGRTISFTNRGFSIFLLLLLSFAFYIYSRYISYGAYRCRRCGEIYCSRCEKRISHEDVCLKCFKTLVKVSELSPKERIEKILEIQRYRDDRNQRLKILTLILPGSGHIYYGWHAQGFLLTLSFTFFFFSTLLWLYIPTPVSMNQIASFFSWMSVIGFILVYASAVINVFRRIPRRWL